METQISISGRYNAAPGVAQGGYISGVIAACFDGPAEVTLRLPTPMDKPLLLRQGAGIAQLLDGEQLLAEGKPGELSLDVPHVPNWEACVAGATRFPGYVKHTVPTCFVCGTIRVNRDGLDIFPGPVSGSTMFGAPWIPGESLRADSGRVAPEIVWAIMDCMCAWPVFTAFPAPDMRAVLGRITGHVRQAPLVGQRCRWIGWPLGGSGRKYYGGTAMISDSDEVMALAHITWIVVQPG